MFFRTADQKPAALRAEGRTLQSQQILAAGMLRQAHLLDLIRNFTVDQQVEGKTRKVMARYQQFLERRAGARPSRVEVRDLGYRWGSCGKTGVLFFNWKVLQLPARLVDYVILHELVHLRERNHGPGLWKALERAMPDWQERKDALAQEAKDYLVFGLSPGGSPDL